MVGLLSASPGGFGGMRGLIALRPLLQMNLGMMIVQQTLSASKAQSAFDAAGHPVDEKSGQGRDGRDPQRCGGQRGLITPRRARGARR